LEISPFSASQAEGRGFESLFPLKQKGPGIAGVFFDLITPIQACLIEVGGNQKRRPRKWPFLFDSISVGDLAPQAQNPVITANLPDGGMRK